jgi:hypothetical protein
MTNDELPRKRPTEIATDLVERAQAGAAAALSTVVLPGGFKWALATAIADAIRRERVVIFKLRDAATAAVSLLPEGAATAALLREAVEFSLVEEDLNLPAFNVRSFLHSPSARLGLLEVRAFTPDRASFEFEDSYTGKSFSLTFDRASEILCGARIDGASLQQLGAMFTTAREHFDRLKEGA